MEIRFESVNKDNPHSWVRISHGLNKLVTDLIDKEYDENEQEEVPAVDGCKGPLLSPPFNPLMVTARKLEERLLGPLPGGIEARPRRRGADLLTVSLIRPGRPVGDGKATPRMTRRYPPEPVSKTIDLPASRSKKKRLSSAPTSCLECGQSERHKLFTTVATRTMQQVMVLEARKSKRSRKHNKKQRGNGERCHLQRV